MLLFILEERILFEISTTFLARARASRAGCGPDRDKVPNPV